ncbi:S-layer homology domain-containing protein [Clostridium sp. 'deep sea']|uniref:S-layer homology domain-containing protein n=1 Tax=Clostridium sp. 'deep sea' TaxID=2779445 RepID=UPI0018964AC9|nr:S-layer homology domain-containing protein [Clostridium sp. 'deep sea']QOR36607.1 S-layer homology domain-containing protein [Clostridium sp. 'deep sea']
MIKKLILLDLLIIVFIFPLKVNALTDISGHWAESDIIILSNEGIINGYNDKSFKPQSPIKRDEFICMVVRLIKEHVGSNTFNSLLTNTNKNLQSWQKDYNKVYYNLVLPNTYWAKNTIKQAVDLRLLPYEYNTTPFLNISDYQKNITRGEAAYILTMAASYYDLHADKMLQNYAIKKITDLNNTHPYKNALLNAYILGIISGYDDNTIKPNNSLSRAEAVATLIKFFIPSRLQPFAPESTPFIMLNSVAGPLTSLRYYPPLINDKIVLDTLNFVKRIVEAKEKTKGYIQLLYNPKNATLGVEFYNSEYDYKQLINASSQSSYNQTIPYTLYMTLTISPQNMQKHSVSKRVNKLNSKYNPYMLITWGNGFEQDILNNHSEVLQELFSYLFDTEASDFMEKLKNYLTYGEGGLTTYRQYNGRYASWKPLGQGVSIIEIMELD